MSSAVCDMYLVVQSDVSKVDISWRCLAASLRNLFHSHCHDQTVLYQDGGVCIGAGERIEQINDTFAGA